MWTVESSFIYLQRVIPLIPWIFCLLIYCFSLQPYLLLWLWFQFPCRCSLIKLLSSNELILHLDFLTKSNGISTDLLIFTCNSIISILNPTLYTISLYLNTYTKPGLMPVEPRRDFSPTSPTYSCGTHSLRTLLPYLSNLKVQATSL